MERGYLHQDRYAADEKLKDEKYADGKNIGIKI